MTAKRGKRDRRRYGGLLLFAGVVLYLALVLAQERAAEALCAANPPGTAVSDVMAHPGTFLLSPRGPLSDPHRPDVERVIYCAALTLCDTSCRLEFRHGVVIDAHLGTL